MNIVNWFLRKELWIKGYNYLRKKGIAHAWKRFWGLFLERFKNFLKGEIGDNNDRYKLWWESQKLNEQRINRIKKKMKKFKYSPVISILVPVYNTPPKSLEACFESVLNQLYPNWQLCVVDDNSSSKKTLEVLEKYKGKDNRIVIKHQKEGKHISLTTNHCLELATGEFVSLLDHDDELHPAALYLMVKELNKNKDWDLIYSDEDKIGKKGIHKDPNFKPDWNPDLLLSNNYICHLAVIRKSLMEKVRGMRKGYEGAQDYDLFLRLTEKTKKIHHIPHVLYHWRKVRGSTAAIYQAKGYADNNALKALKSAIKRRSLKARAEMGIFGGYFRIRYALDKSKKVTIIIPFKDRAKLLERCVRSILERTKYPNYEIFLIDNLSEKEETKRYLEKIKYMSKVKVFTYPYPFNFSAINNWAAKKSNSEYLLFLNNDISVVNKCWLSAMVEHIGRKEVGAVGAKLIYPNKTIQHAGAILGTGFLDDLPGIAGHVHKYLPRNSGDILNHINIIRDYSAVTAACMLTKRKLFKEVGGFDEINQAVAFNDIDYCLKLRKKDYLIVYTPYAELYHYESMSRGSDFTKERFKKFYQEGKNMHDKWGELLQNDPYYNPNLDKRDITLKVNTEFKDIY